MRKNIQKTVRSLILAAIAPVGLGIGGCTVNTTAPQSDVVVAQPAPPPPDATVVVADDPPPAPVEVVGVAPWPDGYWIRGHYACGPRGWYWSRGYWAHRPYGGAVWVGGRYHHGPNGVVWVGGYWR